MSETVNRLMALAAKKFKVPANSLSAQDDFFEKLGINSIEALSLLTEIENEFTIEIPDYELQGVVTFEALAKEIDRRRS